jgi:hypothetical protein
MKNQRLKDKNRPQETAQNNAKTCKNASFLRKTVRFACVQCSGNRPAPLRVSSSERRLPAMVKFLLFFILLVLCWPLALVALVLYPLIWLILIPFRITGLVVGGVLEFIGALFLFPARMLRSI